MKKKISTLLLAVVASINLLNAGMQGALPGAFSVSETKKVYFSQGNLQYQASTKTWRFAINQYDFIGNGNTNISSTYTGWIDLFGFGTSGWNSGYTCHYPYSTNSNISSYIDKNLTDSNANADWGIYNAIINGGNEPNLWRTLTGIEWTYLISQRANANKLYSSGTVNNIVGLILLPDDWQLPNGLTFTPKGNSYSSNSYDASQWMEMEKSGAIFLPAAGWRVVTNIRTTYNVEGTGLRGCYHGATVSSSREDKANYFVNFYSNQLGFGDGNARYCGLSVRLVVDIPSSNVVSVMANNPSYGTVSGGGSYPSGTSCQISATPYEGYYFTQWSDGNTDNPRTVVISQDTTFTAFFEAVQQIKEVVIYEQCESNIDVLTDTIIYFSQDNISDLTFRNKRLSGSVIDRCNVRNCIFENCDFTGVTIDRCNLICCAFWNCNMLASSLIKSNVMNCSLIGSDEEIIHTNPLFEDDDSLFPELCTLPDVKSVKIYSNECTKPVSVIFEDTLSLRLTASPILDHQFIKWSDGNTDNPRTLIITQDTTFVAIFEPIKMSKNLEMIYINGDSIEGFAPDQYTYTFRFPSSTAEETLPTLTDITWDMGDEYQTVTATQAGNTIVLTVVSGRGLVTTYVLSFVIEHPNQYTVTTLSNNDAWGITIGGNVYNANLNVSIGAFANEGYQFYHWNNTIMDNPYTFQLTQDSSFVATFLPNTEEEIITDVTSNSVHMEWEVKPWGNHGYWVWVYIDKDHKQWYCKMRFYADGSLCKFYWGPASKHYDGSEPDQAPLRYIAKSSASYLTAPSVISYDLEYIDDGTQYFYTIEDVDENENVISVVAGTFETPAITTDIENISSSLQQGDRSRLILYNGQIFILRGDKIYTVMGQEVM